MCNDDICYFNKSVDTEYSHGQVLTKTTEKLIVLWKYKNKFQKEDSYSKLRSRIDDQLRREDPPIMIMGSHLEPVWEDGKGVAQNGEESPEKGEPIGKEG